MNWIYVSAGLVILFVASLIVCKKWQNDISSGVEYLSIAIMVVSVFVLICIALIVSLFAGVIIPQETATYQYQKEYIENHISVNEIEDAALTNTKIELNTWLFSAQYCNTRYGNWSLYPDSVQDLEPIE